FRANAYFAAKSARFRANPYFDAKRAQSARNDTSARRARTSARVAGERAPRGISRCFNVMRRLDAPSVECCEGELGRIDAFQAPHVDGEHLLSLRACARRKRTDSAGRTEQVMDVHLVELVIGQILLSGEQLELRGGDEGEQVASLRADRAVA